jgi:hypothetical protein
VASVPRGDSYYLSTCAICDRPLGYTGPALTIVHEQRELRLCSEACRERFLADPASGISHLDSVISQDQSSLYPCDRSVVSGKTLGPHPIEFVWCNRLVRVTDTGEQARFRADPERFVRLLDSEVILAQTPGYGMPKRCPVQGDILDSDEPIDIVVANRMVRVCCTRCVRSVRARPYQYLAMVDYANREAAQRGVGDR